MGEHETTATPPVLVDAETYDRTDPQVVSLTAPTSAAAEQYRLLALRLERAARSGMKRIAITSSTVGDGRTLTAANTAIALAWGRRNRVVLADCDLRGASRGGLERALGLNPHAGLVDVVRGQASLEGVLWRFGDEDMWVLPAGTSSEPHTVAGSRRLGEVLEQLAGRADILLIDAPPVLPTADMQALLRYVDAVVLVVRAGRTSRELMAMALDALREAPLLGCVLVGIAEEAGLPWRLCAEHDRRRRRLPATARPALPARRPVVGAIPIDEAASEGR